MCAKNFKYTKQENPPSPSGKKLLNEHALLFVHLSFNNHGWLCVTQRKMNAKETN